MSAYYNEIDPYAAQWLRNLIEAGHIAAGDVDERSIVEVQPDDLKGYTQCHFFAGIGGWSYAARLAGWPDDRPLWTGSCPCQPFSSAGKQRGEEDERHLWPEFYRLIRQCSPSVVAGEQVASKLGRDWLAGVRADLEEVGYAVGAADLCAAGVGAPHIRQRLWWVADAKSRRCRGRADEQRRGTEKRTSFGGRSEGYGGGVADAKVIYDGRERHPGEKTGARGALRARADDGRFNGVYVPCADGKARRIEPGLKPLAHGVPARVGRLRAYGNAIVPQVAAEFLIAFMECAP